MTRVALNVVIRRVDTYLLGDSGSEKMPADCGLDTGLEAPDRGKCVNRGDRSKLEPRRAVMADAGD